MTGSGLACWLLRKTGTDLIFRKAHSKNSQPGLCRGAMHCARIWRHESVEKKGVIYHAPTLEKIIRTNKIPGTPYIKGGEWKMEGRSFFPLPCEDVFHTM
jgi:hypothetical protein